MERSTNNLGEVSCVCLAYHILACELRSANLLVLLTALTALLPSAAAVDLDVSFVPTPASAALAALRWAGVGPGHVLYELGCGDGRVAESALALGAAVVCVERDPVLAAAASERLLAAAGDGAAELVSVLTDDLYAVNLTGATAVYLFLLPDMNARLLPSLASQLRPGAVVISREFQIVGWPCGERHYVDDAIFLKWTLPVPATAAALDEDAVVEHLLECAAADAVGDGADGEREPERSSTFVHVEPIVFARLGAVVEAHARVREDEPPMSLDGAFL